jgi:hypothetical protein
MKRDCNSSSRQVQPQPSHSSPDQKIQSSFGPHRPTNKAMETNLRSEIKTSLGLFTLEVWRSGGFVLFPKMPDGAIDESEPVFTLSKFSKEDRSMIQGEILKCRRCLDRKAA